MKLTAGQLILVEGIDDMHTVANLFRSLKLTDIVKREPDRLRLRWLDDGSVFEIVPSGGVDSIRDFHETILALRSLDDAKALALVVDADNSVENRWKSIASTLLEMGHTPPSSPASTGTILKSDTARPACIGVWIMPDNQQAGMLETFLGMCVPQGGENPIWQRALAQTDAVRGEIDESSRFKDVHLDKARIHNYLAWNDPPGVPLGQAVLKNILDAQSEQAGVFLQWIRDVFGFHSTSGDRE